MTSLTNGSGNSDEESDEVFRLLKRVSYEDAFEIMTGSVLAGKDDATFAKELEKLGWKVDEFRTELWKRFHKSN